MLMVLTVNKLTEYKKLYGPFANHEKVDEFTKTIPDHITWELLEAQEPAWHGLFNPVRT